MRVLASWVNYPSRIIENPLLVGGKAVGLFKLPKAWVPPFLVFSSEFYSSWQSQQNIHATLKSLTKDERHLIEEFFDRILLEHRRLPLQVLVRSNSPREYLETRGVYKSYTVLPTKESSNEAIVQVLASGKGEPMCVLMQVAISPALVGHMSNERRISPKKDRWLVEGLTLKSKGSGQQFIIALPPKGEDRLLASTEGELLTALCTVAGELIHSDSKRFHCEWAWDGKQVWVVQADKASPLNLPDTANAYIGGKDKPLSIISSTSCLCHFRDVKSDVWKKLRCPKLFDKIGLPTADVYVLTGSDWQKEANQEYSGIKRDLAAMCTRPVVIRCDLASHLETDEALLPTSQASTVPEELIKFMKKVAFDFEKSGISYKNWAFLLASLVPAKASAMVHARPKAERVQIDALWGFPDGLLHFPHDTYYYHTDTDRVTKRIRYKGLCLMPKYKSWLPTKIDEPYDWKPVLSDREVKTLGKWALRLGDELDQDVQLMALARICGFRGPDACLPWHFTQWSVPTYTKSVLALPSSPRIITVESRSKLEYLRNEAELIQAIGYLIKPTPDLLRDTAFLKDAATFASEQGKSIYFEGSLLGHAYYIMSRTGAAVVPIMGGEPKSDRKIYDKIIRDNIPVVIEKAGGLGRIVEIPRSQGIAFLSQKLVEEAFEVWTSSPEELIEELADILEVVEALRNQAGVEKSQLNQLQQKKRAKRGGFDKLLFLEETSLRPLKVESDQEGSLPLLVDDVVLPTRKAAAASTQIRLEQSGDTEELFYFSLPLIPPVREYGGQQVWRLKAGNFVVEARFSGNRVHIRIVPAKVKEISKQLSLFSDATSGGSEK